jgi:hypothetical protein
MRFLDRFRASRIGSDRLLERQFLVPTPEAEEGPRSREVLQEAREFSFVLVQDEDGLPVLPAFTSEDALLRWIPTGSAYVGLEGKNLLDLLARSDWDRIVVDGADPGAFAITRSAAQELLGAMPYLVPAGPPLRIGEPAEAPPDGFVRELRCACERERAVAEAFVYQFEAVDRDEPPHLAVGLRLDAGVDEAEVGRIARSIGDAIDPQSWGYEFVDFHVLDGDMFDTVRSATVPVFNRV